MASVQDNNKRLEEKISQLERLLTVKQLQINSLLEVSQAINNNFSTSALFRIYEFILRAQMGIQKLVVFIKNPDWTCITEAGIKGIAEKINVERDLGQYKMISRVTGYRNQALSQFEIIIPVFHKQTPLAYVLIGELKTDDNDSIEEKIKFIQTITNIVIVAIENKKLFKSSIEQEIVKKELELAARMQSMLIPQNLDQDENIQVSAVYLPHHDVGGDYYDYLNISEDEVALCIGDISGKGLAAALLMANFQANLRSRILRYDKEDTLSAIVEFLNERVNQIAHGEKFISLFIGIYNKKTRKLRYVNAGHNPPYLIQGNELIQLESGTTLLGIFEPLPSIKESTIDILPGSILLTYTDGVVDVENEEGEFFDTSRLEDFIRNNKQLDTEIFNKSLLETVEKFRGMAAIYDDITILTCRFL